MGILTPKRRCSMDAVKRMLCVLVLCLNATQALYGQADSPAAFASGESDRANSAVVVARPSDAEQSGVMSLSDEERRRQRGLTDISTEFVPKGQWIFGGTASYSTHTNESYQFLIIEGIGSKGYNFRISPLIAYALRDEHGQSGGYVSSIRVRSQVGQCQSEIRRRRDRYGYPHQGFLCLAKQLSDGGHLAAVHSAGA